MATIVEAAPYIIGLPLAGINGLIAAKWHSDVVHQGKETLVDVVVFPLGFMLMYVVVSVMIGSFLIGFFVKGRDLHAKMLDSFAVSILLIPLVVISAIVMIAMAP
ncbi:MAG: hypothetical protein ACYSWU_12830 [Planctomycetota bacterium]|jgi:hypothetical protein